MRGIILDTNVISEARRGRPDARVTDWMAARDAEDLFLTATVVGEIAAGIAVLPPGRRRTALEVWLRGVIEREFAGRILAYDLDAAMIFGDIVAGAKAQGRVPAGEDAQIAAVALRDDMTVATRNIRDFAPLGVRVVNPWDAAEPA